MKFPGRWHSKVHIQLSYWCDYFSKMINASRNIVLEVFKMTAILNGFKSLGQLTNLTKILRQKTCERDFFEMDYRLVASAVTHSQKNLFRSDSCCWIFKNDIKNKSWPPDFRLFVLCSYRLYASTWCVTTIEIKTFLSMSMVTRCKIKECSKLKRTNIIYKIDENFKYMWKHEKFLLNFYKFSIIRSYTLTKKQI